MKETQRRRRKPLPPRKQEMTEFYATGSRLGLGTGATVGLFVGTIVGGFAGKYVGASIGFGVGLIGGACVGTLSGILVTLLVGLVVREFGMSAEGILVRTICGVSVGVVVAVATGFAVKMIMVSVLQSDGTPPKDRNLVLDLKPLRLAIFTGTTGLVAGALVGLINPTLTRKRKGGPRQ